MSFYNHRITGIGPEPLFVKFYETRLQEKLKGYEALLSKSKYIAGEVSRGVAHAATVTGTLTRILIQQHLTLIDLFHLPYGAMLKIQGYNFLESEQFPNVAR